VSRHPCFLSDAYWHDCVINGPFTLQEMGGSLEVVHLGHRRVITQLGEGGMNHLHYDPFPHPLTRPQYPPVLRILVVVVWCLVPRILWCLCLHLVLKKSRRRHLFSWRSSLLIQITRYLFLLRHCHSYIDAAI
jgi:hypothetical protein